jgi:hypothetical protein
MTTGLSPLLAEAAPVLTGGQLASLLMVLAGTAVVMVLIRLGGNWLAATHPEEQERSRPAAGGAGLTEEEWVLASAAVAAVIGRPCRVLSVSKPKAPVVDNLMQVWSMEGRRQIYSSHKIR